ncbi:unnamed protein product [Staurois parvus]|uniref:Asparagine--tRNA ligase n=1 Tax=Staurois parvus TaxID=386267 RepID=A0ABN9C5P9_9NEOB|nr:unnamed protein product [Staurois parvus]
MGWVRTFRNTQFISLYDGSSIENVQIVLPLNTFPESIVAKIHTGTSLKIKGVLIPSKGKGQQVEIVATAIEVLGTCDAEKYPLQPKKHSLEFLRDIAHLRMRTLTFNAIFKVRHMLAFAIHSYFNSKGFYYIHSPIITASDAEGAGEMFQVTTWTNRLYKRFFGKPVTLTVSGQLEAELAAMGMGEVYTFGPTFRAEKIQILLVILQSFGW